MPSWPIEEFRDYAPEFDQFIRDLSKWLDDGKPISNPYDFTNSIGICFSYENWCIFRQIECVHIVHIFVSKCDTFYPFNQGVNDYHREIETGTIYKNPKRLDFIREAMETING